MNPTFVVSSAYRFVIFAFCILVLCLCAGTVSADAALILSRGTGNDAIREVTLKELAALPQKTVVTETEWSDGRVAYKGPLMRDVLKLFNLEQMATLRFMAANDYYIDIPTKDFQDYDVILAMSADGKPLSRRDKGPLWVMYPLSDHKELNDNVYLARLIWQLVRIESQ